MPIITPIAFLLVTAPVDALPGDYLMTVDAATDRLVVKVNDKTFTFQGNPRRNGKIHRIDIEPYLVAGPNQVQISYGQLGPALGGVRISYARSPGRYRVAFRYHFQNIFPPQNNKMYTFVADGPVGAGRISQGSADDQTLLKYQLSRTTVKLTVNGTFLGDFPGFGERDVSNYIRPGRNTVKVAWSGPNATVSLGYANIRNEFRRLWSWRKRVSGPNVGEETFTVDVPSRR